MQTIKRTQSRQVPILLKAKHEDRGPYYLVDRAGYGVSWVKPVVVSVPGPVDETRPSYMASFSTTRRTTWVPIFDRALLAFELLEQDESVTPKEAKAAADETAKDLGMNRVSTMEALAYAQHQVEKERAKRAVKGGENRTSRNASISSFFKRKQKVVGEKEYDSALYKAYGSLSELYRVLAEMPPAGRPNVRNMNMIHDIASKVEALHSAERA